MNPPLTPLLSAALDARADALAATHDSALRLFNGFTEGAPTLVVDLYGTTAVFHNHADPATAGDAIVQEAQQLLQERLPWVQTSVLKARHSLEADERRGTLLLGDTPDTQVCEHGVRYAIDLQMNRDASLYLDTRNLRRWLIDHTRDRSVLNTFAYTGSLGVAARAGGAKEVVQLDRNSRFLELARRSVALNEWPPAADEFLLGDFFPKISQLKRAGRRFDCVIIDPPFFATTSTGVVDLASDSARLINKVRPLINDGGHLIAINNALFVSGQEFYATLEQLCGDGYLSIEELIPVPEDITGYPTTRTGTPVTDPAPFNHSTKIAVLAVRRKQA